VKRLSEKIAEEFDWYVAISRGGLVPAALLSQLTNMRKIDTLCVESYSEDKTRSEVRVIEKDYSHLKGQRVLIVDDLADSGQTLEFVMSYLVPYGPKTLKTAVIYKKKGSHFKPDYYIEERPAEDWIDFSWEVDQEIK